MSKSRKLPAKPRPTEYSDDLAAQVVDKYVSGYTFARMAREFEHLPSAETLNLWHKEIPEFRQRVVTARELHADALAQDTLEIADNDFDPARARNRIAARQWLAGKYKPSTYGDRIDVNVKQVSITAALADAKARLLRPVSDQLQAIEGQAIEILDTINSRPTDKETVSPENEADIDIFS